MLQDLRSVIVSKISFLVYSMGLKPANLLEVAGKIGPIIYYLLKYIYSPLLDFFLPPPYIGAVRTPVRASIYVRVPMYTLFGK